MKKIFIHVLTIALIAALAFGCLAGCTAAPKTEQVTPATPTTSATTETSADPAAATDLSGKKVALVLFGTNFDYFVYIGASAKKTAEEAIKYLESLDEINGEVICLNCPEGESLGDIRLPGIVVTPETVADFIAQQDKEYEALAPYKP